MMIQSWPFYDEDDDENTKDNFDKNFPVENQNWYHWDDQDVENGGLSENKKSGSCCCRKDKPAHLIFVKVDQNNYKYWASNVV